jgi:uncharacterized protein
LEKLWLTPDLATEILADIQAGKPTAECSLDLGLTRQQIVLGQHGLHTETGTDLSVEMLREIAAAKRGVYRLDTEGLQPVQITTDAMFYKLIPTDEAPTIEISGIQMHRTTGTHPYANAYQSARSVVRKGKRVLDTCGGLGYTAIAAARLGAATVVSADVDLNVRAVAKLNPWSSDYFEHPAIQLVTGDSFDLVADMEARSFDCVIHDPPRFSRAGHLYSGDFYRQLARVLTPRGRVFHYTGDPYSHGRGRSFVEGVILRMRDAGFEVRRADSLQGVTGRRI